MECTWNVEAFQTSTQLKNIGFSVFLSTFTTNIIHYKLPMASGN